MRPWAEHTCGVRVASWLGRVAGLALVSVGGLDRRGSSRGQATAMERSVPINDVQRVMGHEQASTTLNMYTHAASEQDRYGRVLGVFAAFSLPSGSRQHITGDGQAGEQAV